MILNRTVATMLLLTLLVSKTAAADGSAPLVAGETIVADAERVLIVAEEALIRGQHPQASALAHSALDRDPGSHRALKIIGMASCMMRDPRQASEARDRLLGLDRVLVTAVCARQGLVLSPTRVRAAPTEPRLSGEARSLYAKARSRLRGANYEEALPLLRRVYRLDPRPQLLFEITRCYLHTGQLAHAVAVHQRYVRCFKEPAEQLVAAARFGALVQETRDTPR